MNSEGWFEFGILHVRRSDTDDLEGTAPLLTAGTPRFNDDIRFDMHFPAPLFVMLIALNPNGSIQFCVPENVDQAVSAAVTELHYPEIRSQGFALTDGIGQQAFLLITSESPLPSPREWMAKTGTLEWTADMESGTWIRKDRQVRPWSERRTRGPTRDLPGKKQFEMICDTLEQKPGVRILGISFPVSER